MSKTMSENRESLELNGVTFYFVRNENYYMAKICNDIDIKAGIEEVTFEFDKIGNYEFMDNKKVFPEVKTINIKKWGRNLRIPNSMFPNVTKVVVDKYCSSGLPFPSFSIYARAAVQFRSSRHFTISSSYFRLIKSSFTKSA